MLGPYAEVTRVNPTILRSLVNDGYTPVVATVATDEKGQALNVNADTAAGEVSHVLLLRVLEEPPASSLSCLPCSVFPIDHV